METIAPETESIDGGFFAVRSRSGDPTTEDLHSRTSHPKRFNSGKTYGLLGGRRAGVRDSANFPAGTATGTPGGAPATTPLVETETHSVLRAGRVPVTVATAVAECRCSGRVLSHGWSFLCSDGGVLAWEQGMVSAERTGAAVGADQAYLRFEHPVMFQELAATDSTTSEAPVEAADLVALTQPWEARGGKRELLLVSPRGLARYWPDLHSPRRYTDVDARDVAPAQSVTRVVALGPADFLCGMSQGGVLRIRPGLSKPCLLAQTASVLVRGFSTIKRMGWALAGGGAAPVDPTGDSSLGTPSSTSSTTPVVALSVSRPPPGSAPSVPSRVVRLSTESLEVWSVLKGEGGGSGMECLEVRQPLASQIQRALGVRKTCLVDVAVVGALSDLSTTRGVGEGDGERRAGGRGESSVASSTAGAVMKWGLELLVLAVVSGGERSGEERDKEAFSVHAVRISSEEASWVGSSVTAKLLSSHRVAEEGTLRAAVSSPSPSPAASFPSGRQRATLVVDKEKNFFAGEGCCLSSATAPLYGGVAGVGDRVGREAGGGSLAHVLRWTPSASSSVPSASSSPSSSTRVWSMYVKMGAVEGRVEWEVQGSVEVSDRVALVGGCAGGGGALLGCPGVVLLSSRGQAVWVAPRREFSAGVHPVDLDLLPRITSTSGATAAVSGDTAVEEWRSAIIDEGLSAFEAGESMDTARAALESLLSRAALDGSAASKDLDTAIVLAEREVLNGTWRHPSAFASPHQLVHLALTEKARRHRALVRFLMDAGAWGSASAGRAALAEGGEKIAAAARLYELQDAISRKSIGSKAVALLDECISLALERGQELERGGATAGATTLAPKDIYFERTEGVLDLFVELHTPRSCPMDSTTRTPLMGGLRDPSLVKGDRLPLLDHLSVVVTGVFEAALRHRASERSVYRTGLRGKVWTASVEARRILFRQLLAYTEPLDGIALKGDPGGGSGGSETTRGVIGRLSVLLLDGFKEEEEANPVVAGRVEWLGEYIEAKALCVKVLAACGREDLARTLAAEHGFDGGTVSLCHEAELRKPGCENGHRLLRQRMAPPPTASPPANGRGDVNNSGDDGDVVETSEARMVREKFALFVLDWHLKRGLKTALLDVGAAVPDILCEFLADWREAELLWIFQLRLRDYTGAEQALTRGSPPANQTGGKCEAQHLWLSLAKLAYKAGEGKSGTAGTSAADSSRGAEIQRRLELAEVRERLVEYLPDGVLDKNHIWTWEDALSASTQLLSSSARDGSPTEPLEVEKAADIAFQGYRALVVGMSQGSRESAFHLWQEVVGITLGDPLLGEAVAKGAMSPSAENGTITVATDREMEAVWKRPTVLHLLLRAIQKYRRLRREEAQRAAGGGATTTAAAAAAAAATLEVEEAKLCLTDESLSTMVRELMPAAADARGASCEAWTAAIRKCPW